VFSDIKTAPCMNKIVIKKVEDHLKYLQVVKNLSRQKMLLMTLCSMLKSRSVLLTELAENLNADAKTESNENRLQNFFREVPFDYEALAKFLFSFLCANTKDKIRLSIDRTEWDFGIQQTNILMIIASKGNFTVPLYWAMLDNNSGNSNSEDRITLLKKCIELIGSQHIGLVLGDREFIGHVWLKFLKTQKIAFCVRVPKNHQITAEDGTIYQAEVLWLARKEPIRFQSAMVDGIWGSVLIDTDAQGKLLYLFGTANIAYFKQFYKKRWTIETVFQAFKGRGFNLEQTHLKFNDRLQKMVGIVAMAYAFCTSMGIFKDQNIKKIRIKNHNRKEMSYFKCGLKFFRDFLKNGYKYHQECMEIFQQFIQFVFKNNDFCHWQKS
jgi:hypothetical protein